MLSLSNEGSSLHRFCQDSAPAQASLRVLLCCGLLQGLQVDLCTPKPSRGCRGSAPSPWAASQNFRGISSLEPAAAPSSPPALPWMFAVLFLPHSPSSLPPSVVQYLYHFLKYVITEVLPVFLKGSALASHRSIMELGEASGIFSQKSLL